ncbi:MAG: DUF262 domain-containing protein [Nitrospiraceae bacterium]|nr:DUF262 domain-containing protein [Nitrospiraceae bacterium]
MAGPLRGFVEEACEHVEAIEAAVLGVERAPTDTDKINDLYLTNRYQEGSDQYKLLPTQGDEPSHNDRTVFARILDGRDLAPTSNSIQAAFQHFSRLLRGYAGDQLANLANSILNRVFLVSIVLEQEDNPYSIFESLNAKGQPLTQADLVRNYFFMCIPSARHERIFSEKWAPMERSLGREHMETYIRHFIIRDGGIVKEADVYFALKRKVEAAGTPGAEAMLDELVSYSRHYERFLNPSREGSREVHDALVRLQRLRATVCYPFLLNVFEDRSCLRMTDKNVVDIIALIENFIVRRYVCGTKRSELNELFPVLYRNASSPSNP